jgi:hypothetical protein
MEAALEERFEEMIEKVWETEGVHAALRLGWAIAETRGRLRRGPPHEATAVAREGHGLPLAGERSWSEQTIETQTVARALAEKLSLDVPLARLSGFGRGRGKVADRLTDVAIELANAREAGDEAAVGSSWESAARLLYAWDAKIQDELAGRSYSVASGYQLGRALAETYWALDAGAEPGKADSWTFLLGSERATAIGQLVRRLSSFFLPLTPGAIGASVSAWAHVAADSSLPKQPATADALHEQLHVWHDLLLTGQPPESLLPRESVLKRARRIGPVLQAFLPEFAVGIGSMLAAALAAGLFLGGGGRVHWLAGVLAVMSFFGITGSGALAKIKGEAHALYGELQTSLKLDAIREAVTLPPARVFLDRR